MPPLTIIPPDSLDCDKVLYTREQIYEVLPQKYEFSLLDGIIHADTTKGIFAAYRTVATDEWWCRGHMPQQAIFPGVLMVESAAQLCAFSKHLLYPEDRGIMGFGGIDKAKFRDSVFPPARIIIVARVIDKRSRKFTCAIQSFSDGKMAFEGNIVGMRLKM